MRGMLMVYLAVVLLHQSEGTSSFNRNGGLVRAFNGDNPDNNNRDTEVISVAGDPTKTALEQGVDIGITASFFSTFEEPIDVMVCFQTGFCEAQAGAANPAWAITSPPSESTTGTGMAHGHANVLFAPYVVPYDDATYSYSIAYRLLDYSNSYDRADIEDLLSRKYDSVPVDKNTITDTILATYKGVVVTWKITNLAGETSKFQMALFSDGTVYNNNVLYLFDVMGLSGITNNVRGYVGGGASKASARVCSSFNTAATDTDAALLEVYLPLYSNDKCGKPGNYLFDVSPPSSNIAEGKPTKQSLDYHDYQGYHYASRAVDGNRNQNFFHASCSTTTTNNPWWQVDLGNVYDIFRITIYRRTDCLTCKVRMKGFQAFVTELETYDTADDVPVYVSPNDVEEPDDIINILLKPSVMGRFVKIEIPGRFEHLTLCEVEIYGENFCGVTATECSSSYTSEYPSANSNATSAPMDSCLVSSYCHRDATDPNIVNLTVTVDWYKLTPGIDTYMQALMYSSWQPDLSADPIEQQVFVEKDASPHSGVCGKALTLSSESISVAIDVTDTDKNRCGVAVDGTGTAQNIFFAFKIFEYTYNDTVDDFGPNAMVDKWGNWVITGKCSPGDLLISVSQTVKHNGPFTPTALPARQQRSCTMKIVDSIDDTGANELTHVTIGQPYFLQMCCDHGSPYNPQADPFGIYAVSCRVSNRADFMVDDIDEDAAVEFIKEVAIGDDSCPIANGASTGPLYMNSDFKVRSSLASYEPSDASFPTNPWCISTDKIHAARYHFSCAFEVGNIAA